MASPIPVLVPCGLVVKNGSNKRGRVRQVEPQRNVTAGQWQEHTFHVAKDGVQVELYGVQHLTTTKGEELAREPRAARGRAEDRAQIFLRRRIGR
ncbi:MAG: hypothetical protein O2973_12415 [Gemmatimonadetes bacterium]|nr:hypothetical protein [Gemmatimonadota bacterium]